MKSILIIGLGRFGRHMAQKFIENGQLYIRVERRRMTRWEEWLKVKSEKKKNE